MRIQSIVFKPNEMGYSLSGAGNSPRILSLSLASNSSEALDKKQSPDREHCPGVRGHFALGNPTACPVNES
jgi:hypothetical protein